MKKAAQTANGRLSQETPAVSISAQQELNDAELASRLRDISIDSLKRLDEIIRAEFDRRGIYAGTGRAIPKSQRRIA